MAARGIIQVVTLKVTLTHMQQWTQKDFKKPNLNFEKSFLQKKNLKVKICCEIYTGNVFILIYIDIKSYSFNINE